MGRRSRRGSRVNYAELNDGYDDSQAGPEKAGEEAYVEPKRSPRRSPRKHKNSAPPTAAKSPADIVAAPMVDRKLLDTSDNSLNVNVFVPNPHTPATTAPEETKPEEPEKVEEIAVVQEEPEMIPETVEEVAEEAEMIPEAPEETVQEEEE